MKRTSSVVVAQVGKPPHVAQAHWVSEQREQKVEATRPGATFVLRLPDSTGSWPSGVQLDERRSGGAATDRRRGADHASSAADAAAYGTSGLAALPHLGGSSDPPPAVDGKCKYLNLLVCFHRWQPAGQLPTFTAGQERLLMDSIGLDSGQMKAIRKGHLTDASLPLD